MYYMKTVRFGTAGNEWLLLGCLESKRHNPLMFYIYIPLLHRPPNPFFPTTTVLFVTDTKSLHSSTPMFLYIPFGHSLFLRQIGAVIRNLTTTNLPLLYHEIKSSSTRTVSTVQCLKCSKQRICDL